MKNKPPMAKGCLKNVLMPSLTQAMPARAGTTFRETTAAEEVGEVEGKFEDDMCFTLVGKDAKHAAARRVQNVQDRAL